MSEEIQIAYSGPTTGLVGERPRRIAVNTEFHFKSVEGAPMTVEFLNNSPFANGDRVHPNGVSRAATRTGLFPFKCTLHNPPGPDIVLGSDGHPIGGELDIVPGA